jgi:protein-tyrosine phosphatase
VRTWTYRLYRPGRNSVDLRWLGDSRLGVGRLPSPESLSALPGAGVTDVVNCRMSLQVWFSGDLSAERRLFGPGHVAWAPMWDVGRPQPPRRWARAARFAAQRLAADPAAKVFVHCQHGRHRSVMVAYAVLRLRGLDEATAWRLIEQHHELAELPPVYRASVEHWLTGA